jgi:hypothetical protein
MKQVRLASIVSSLSEQLFNHYFIQIRQVSAADETLDRPTPTNQMGKKDFGGLIIQGSWISTARLIHMMYSGVLHVSEMIDGRR